MKNAILFLATFSFLFSATITFADSIYTDTRTLETQITCSQSDGDQWFSIGMGKTRKGIAEMIVVKNNVDDDSKKLVGIFPAKVTDKSKEIVYTTNTGTFKLVVSKKIKNGATSGELIVLESGRNSYGTLMECELNSEIEFEFDLALEPRLGAGN